MKRAPGTLPTLIVVGLVLWGSIDTGVVGQIADGRQMIFTAAERVRRRAAARKLPAAPPEERPTNSLNPSVPMTRI